MSNNIGNLTVGLGYDLSGLEQGGAAAFRTVSTQTQGLSAEMKRTSQEGSESFRLIDEALGIHVSRPLTRIIGQTQTLGPILAGVFQFSAMAAIGVVIAEQAKRLFEITGATEAWKDILGLTAETAEQAAKRIESGDQALLKSLHEKIEMQDAYNQLVAGLKGSDFERAHIAMLKEETAEIQKQILLQATQVQSKANEEDWRQWFGHSMFSGAFTALGMGAEKGQMSQQAEANKMALAMKPLFDAIHQINLELQKDNWKIFRDDADEAAKQAKEDIQQLQGDLKGWNDEANKGWTEWMKINAELETALTKLDDLQNSAKRFQEASKVFFPSIQQVGPPPGAPQLADQAELQKVTTDQNEAWTKAGEIVSELESPLEKFATQLAILKQLEEQGRITTEQFAQAQQVLQEQLAQSENRMEKLLKGGGALGGIQAFMMQLKGQGTKGSDGQFTFDLLNKGLEGFEDETVKVLTGAKANWSQFFMSLDQMVLKFFLSKMLTQLLGGLPGLLGNLFGGAGAGTNIGSLSQAAGGGGIGLGSSVPGYASGTDFAPGGLSWVGENGPELMNVPAGASITPTSALRGSSTQNIYIDAKGAEIGVEQKIARYFSAMAPSLVVRAVAEASEIQKRTPH